MSGTLAGAVPSGLLAACRLMPCVAAQLFQYRAVPGVALIVSWPRPTLTTLLCPLLMS
jgi:hypothetical protein